MNDLTEKFLEVLRSVLPIGLLVLLMHFTVTPIEGGVLSAFIVGTLFVIIGLTIFLWGVDIAISPIGQLMGKGIAKSNKIWVVIVVGFLLGFFISVAEPSLIVLADQVSSVTGGAIPNNLLIIVVSIGLGVMVVLGLLRLVYSFSLNLILMASYGLIFLLVLIGSNDFMAIAFDASGATTGAVTVPFMLALSVGIANLKKNSRSSEDDSFGLVAIASAGAIMAVLVLSIFSGAEELTGEAPVGPASELPLFQSFASELWTQFGEVLITVAPILIIFLIYQFTLLKLPKRRFRRILLGMTYVYIGLSVFLAGVNAGFMGVGSFLGYQIAETGTPFQMLALSFGLGVVTILAEPAVTVQTKQIEDVTGGSIKRGPVLFALALGVGLAIFFAMLRILIPSLQLWHFLLPGYIISLGLSCIVPKVFVGMAFDAGGVASGPMTGTFILAFVQGAAESVESASVLIDGFGMIALVAMMPIVSLQLLGFVYMRQSKTES